ncbi:hypothetical protein HYV89_04580 [Candidatus Woesearchaeota archaeon]|nr:hypothetical protein [Candidatus Woesearchaeota archaeon]
MKERNIMIIVAVVLALAALSPLVIIKNPNEYEYNNFKLQKSPTGWVTWAYKGEQPYLLQLRHDPKTLENITVDDRIRDLVLSKPALATTIDPNLTSRAVLGAIDIANILGRRLGLYGIQVIGATTEFANNGTYVIDCSDVQKDLNVAVLKLGEKTEIKLEGNCIIIQGATEEDINRAADRFIYEIIEVME